MPVLKSLFPGTYNCGEPGQEQEEPKYVRVANVGAGWPMLFALGKPQSVTLPTDTVAKPGCADLQPAVKEHPGPWQREDQ